MGCLAVFAFVDQEYFLTIRPLFNSVFATFDAIRGLCVYRISCGHLHCRSEHLCQALCAVRCQHMTKTSRCPGGDGCQRPVFGRKIVTLDRKSTRLNSSHVKISYAVFCLKKKKK